ncbi:LysR family transcriptional regulator [Rhizobium laguerreae]|uniref:LysR family transcriptional regulator n=1 Tax=Rhizobium laguerreae TaxID=1076926 RepID=UPI0014426D56|nr:LysR family transcriptional regulator [Rhizobium laguerreae]MBY3321387.1 LysR family transcriptional regulator [Rhizobium laguerreae]MBY3362981.1 LysR family transcriptional regulator [Rhizobium laguerreae]NKM66476.1 LysR family transcriptional regulator [Rhizobium laguerreae]
MDKRRLEAFVQLSQELNFTRAARLLNMTQSTLSAAIRTLEIELDVVLFERSTRSVALTDHGRLFLPHARAAISALDSAKSAVSPSGGLKGSLTVGMLNGLRMIDIPALAGDFHRRHPDVQLRLEAARRGTDELVERLGDGSVDIAFVGSNLTDKRLRVIPIRSYKLQLIIPSSHSLAKQRSATLDQIAQEPFVDMPRGFGQRAAIDDAFTRQALPRSVQIEVAELKMIPDYVEHGLGIALLPPELIPAARPGLTVIPLRDVEIEWTLSVVVKAVEATSRTVSAFLHLIPQYTSSDHPF